MAPKKKSPSTKDLKPRTVKGSKAAAVKGGKVTMQDIRVTRPVDSSSSK